MRDLMILMMMMIIIPMCLRNAFAAYLLWGWSGLIAVHTFAYSYMMAFPFVVTFAVISLVLILLRRDPDIRPNEFGVVNVTLIWFGLHAVLCASMAYSGLPRNWEITLDLLKTLLYALLMPMLVTSRLRIHAIVLMLALSAGYHGVLEGLKFIASGGGHISQGNPKLGDRNHFAVLVTMCLPFMLYLLWYSRSRLLQLGAVAGLLVNVLATIATHSRGGLLSLITVAAYFVLISKRKLLGLATMVVVGAVGLVMAPESWTNRMESIQTANTDDSFMGRVIAWKRASAIALEHPIFGGGIRAVQSGQVMEKYRFEQGLLGWVETPPATRALAAHSIYFEVMSDMGFLGLFIFLVLMASPFVIARRVRKVCDRIGPSADWSKDLAYCICAGMVGFLSGGASISAAYFEFTYILIALAAVNLRVISQAQATPQKPVAAVGPAAVPV